MRRDLLLLEEMIWAAAQAVALVEGVAVEDLGLQIGAALTRPEVLPRAAPVLAQVTSLPRKPMPLL